MHDILKALELVLVEERSAIRKLDTNNIERAATKKTELEARLSAKIAEGETATKDDHAILERVRAAARANQLLLVHARACIRGVVALVSGKMPDTYPTVAAPAAAAAPAVRVNMTG
jgi:hypothetical protein